MAGKAVEYKESTAKALHPEISRLQMQHERELAEAQQGLQAQERALRESMVATLQARLDEERGAAKDELRLSAKAQQDKAQADWEALGREHRRKVQQAAEEQERDLEKYRLFLKDKAQRSRERAHQELRQLQEGAQQRLQDLKQRHLKHIEQLQADHETEVRYSTILWRNFLFSFV